jgi:hypothetical protein
MSAELLSDNAFRKSLEKAARRSKVNINTLGMVSVLRADSALVIAPIREFDVSPATELKKGVNSAFAYINSPDRNVPAGYYTLRITADAVKIGAVSGTLEYVDSRGQTANKSSVQLDIKSLTLPNPPALPHAVINVESRQVAHTGDLALTPLRDTVIVCCPNGYCWFEKK